MWQMAYNYLRSINLQVPTHIYFPSSKSYDSFVHLPVPLWFSLIYKD